MRHYKDKEFAAFIQSIQAGQVSHWQDIARAIGVDENTITRWKKLPEAQEAIQKGIDNAIEQMQLSGKRDWRMWESKLKMLGVNPATKVEANVTNPIELIISKYGSGEGVSEVPRITTDENGSSEDNA